MNNKEIIKSNNNSLRKVKNFPSVTSIWSNSIYSFNQNYLKNIPAVDNIVNKLIKSFFSINALANNAKGKKSKLIQRRYKRLSLNKILVSKSEIKHNNDKVYITVYLFNKKKKSLLLKLKNLGLNWPISNKSLSLDKTNNMNDKGANLLKAMPLNTISLNNALYKNSDKSKVSGQVSKVKGINNMKSGKDLFNNISLNKYISIGLLGNKVNHSVSYLNRSVSNIMNNNRFFDKPAQNINNISITKDLHGNAKGVNTVSQINAKTSFVNSVRYYKNLSLTTKHNIHKFVNTYANNTNVIKKDTNILNINTTSIFNKYKLYSNIKDTNTLETNQSLVNIAKNNYSKLFKGLNIDNKDNIKPNYSIYKLRSMNKLFVLYNNINSEMVYNKGVNTIQSNKILLNTYKLLRKSYGILSTKGSSSQIINNNTRQSNMALNPYNIAHMSRKIQGNKIIKGNYYSIKGLAPKNKSYVNIRKSMKNIILINKLNRIDKFFDKYKNTFLTLNNSSNNNHLALQQKIAFIINNYKVNFINEVMEKELLYIYYLKLLSYNDIIFKNWFLYSLKNIISKIYNKKVIFNLVNLKYIHLNSDILSEAVNIRLRNFKKNRVVKVLKKVIKLVPISKVNIYACDEHSAIYKYVNSYHNKFRTLKLEIFKELGIAEEGNLNSHSTTTYTGPRRNGALKKLNHIQASTINFIKYKSAFGVRLEAAGRLTKRSTASRSIFKYRYNGTLRNNAIINNNISSVIIKDNRISNLQFTQISSKTRNGSFGLKGWINNN